MKELKVGAGIDAGIAGMVLEKITALGYLQSIYRDPLQPASVRMRAAALAIPFESPKLAVIAQVADDGSFAERLERALARSGVKVIEHRPEDRDV
jgi:hypothetical protein